MLPGPQGRERRAFREREPVRGVAGDVPPRPLLIRWRASDVLGPPCVGREFVMRSHSALRSLAAAATPLMLAGSALAGPDWIEIGDAGSDVPGAQVPIRPPGAGQLATIG